MTTRARVCSLRLPVLAAASLALGLAGCGDSGPEGGFTMPPMAIEVAEATAGTVVDRFTAVGSLEASEAITVVSEIDGTVIDVPFAEGQAIAAGGLIAQLDRSELAAQVDRAEAVRDQRRVTYERVSDVVEQGAGAPQDLDDAAAALKVADAELALARARLAKTRIAAPFAGITGVRQVSQGAFVRAGGAITDLTRIDLLRVHFTAPERVLPQLAVGSEVRVHTSAYPDLELVGAIDVISPVLDPATRTARIVAEVNNRDDLLRPGMSADVGVVLASRENAVTVPSEAVFVQSGQTLVYVVQADSTVAPQPVTLGLRQTDVVEVAAGLAPGAKVVRAGHQKLFPGARVLPVGGDPGPGGAAAGPAGAPPAAAQEDGR
ncbi:MAG TPA: efflux RND transporter periplasmic adaptor subunit [Candidatus Krumholzibacteria bacterium]|nr:efflux RND transporter periplasmic adaptor subunit [Candidatus Krumholzibacteria bacterium]HPD72613.1 efflux RND transporter periplasmic adaptor subunit [Candidatus Krumholzibacteria bacterium]HRY40455.1 efflux RND transporter periplasmic adaptor subunit [Candidatus Krumholzibacteria bacterium]